jgi:hypothetical protein
MMYGAIPQVSIRLIGAARKHRENVCYHMMRRLYTTERQGDFERKQTKAVAFKNLINLISGFWRKSWKPTPGKLIFMLRFKPGYLEYETGCWSVDHDVVFSSVPSGKLGHDHFITTFYSWWVTGPAGYILTSTRQFGKQNNAGVPSFSLTYIVVLNNLRHAVA